ncbi:MAG: hypothetical protein ACFCD0_09810 [Gemmataceae bacterium]
MSETTETKQLLQNLYTIVIVVVVGMAIGRIFAVERVYEPSLYAGERWPKKAPPALPTFSSNDRSRWATVRALVDHNTYSIGTRTIVVLGENNLNRDRCTWQEGRRELTHANLIVPGVGNYTPGCGPAGPISQVALASLVTEAELFAPNWESGWDTVDKVLHPETKKFYSTKPPLLPTIMAGLYWLLWQLTGWTFATDVWKVVKTIVILVNVVPFVVYLAFLAKLLERFCRDDWSRLLIFATAGFGTLVTPFLISINNHTVATFSVLFALYSALMILCGEKDGSRVGSEASPLHFLNAGSFSAFAVCNELPVAAFLAGITFVLLLRAPAKTLLYFVPPVIGLTIAFFFTNYIATGEWLPLYTKFGSEWYQFEGSHWSKPEGNREGIDFASDFEPRSAYIFHALLGHHGWFSLTPIWLLALGGMLAGAFKTKHTLSGTKTMADRLPWYFYPMVLLLSVIIIGFYLTRSGNLNYSGWSAGLRWLMWLTPMWLLCLIPTLEGIGKSVFGRWIGYVLLGFSILSASFPAWNPWRHPWIYRAMDAIEPLYVQ